MIAAAASTGVHAVLLVCLGLVWLMNDVEQPTFRVNSLLATESPREELDLIEITSLIQPKQTNSPLLSGGRSAATRTRATVSRPRLTSHSNRSLFTATADWQQLAAADVSAAVGAGTGTLTRPNAGEGGGTGASIGDGTGHSFFDVKPIGRRFVYVLDCSRSMNHPHDSDAKTRFKRMKLELLKSVSGLNQEMEFFLIFFNDAPIAMPSPTVAPAVSGAKQRYLYWMQKLKADGHTEPTSAMQLAMRLKPDVLYFLTDGNFVHRTQQELLGLPLGRTQIHTFAFEEPFNPSMQEAYRLLVQGDRVGARNAVSSNKDFKKTNEAWKSHEFLKRLSKSHHGTFHLIPNSG